MAGHWWGVFWLSSVLTMLPSLLNFVGPWAVTVGQGLAGPLSTVGMTRLYWEVRGKGEELSPSNYPKGQDQS